jgi:copper homeostasis protein
MTRALLEVIALDAADAVAAEQGGADRLEVVTGMDQDGLTPSPETVAAIRAVTGLPLRVMLRTGAGFLDDDGDLDLAAMRTVSTAVDLPWTCHRAIDHARDRDLAWRQLGELPGLDTVLTAGSPDGVSDGLSTLVRHAADGESAARILAGGGLLPDHVPSLAAAGITQFHVGSLARQDRSWSAPVDADRVRAWRDRIDSARVTG